MSAEQKASVKATSLLAALTVAGFIVELGIGIEAARKFVLSRSNILSTGYVIVTYAFLHSGFGHLGGNLLSLLVQGKLLERTVGSGRMALIYVTGIVGGGISWLAFNSGVTVSGASAATSAIMAANMVISPGRSLVDEIPIVRKFPLPVLRSVMNVSLWTAVAILVNIQLTIETGSSSATFAHLGGIVTGIATVFLLTDKGTKKGLIATAGFAAALSAVTLVSPDSIIWKLALLGIILLVIIVRRTRKRSV